MLMSYYTITDRSCVLPEQMGLSFFDHLFTQYLLSVFQVIEIHSYVTGPGLIHPIPMLIRINSIKHTLPPAVEDPEGIARYPAMYYRSEMVIHVITIGGKRIGYEYHTVTIIHFYPDIIGHPAGSPGNCQPVHPGSSDL